MANANEMLGLPPRTFFELAKLAAGLRERPLLRQAVIAGEVSPVKARVVMDRAIGEAEAGFVAAAIEMTVNGGGSVPCSIFARAMCLDFFSDVAP